MKNILITGSNGLVGSKLIQLLTSQYTDQYTTIATGRGANRLPTTQGYTYHSLDSTDIEGYTQLFTQYHPIDTVIHTAAYTQVDAAEIDKQECYQANVVAVEILANLCKTHGTHLVYLSTDFVFDGKKQAIYDEKDTPNPLSYYAETKYQAEQKIQQIAPSYSIARTIIVYGYEAHLSRSNIILWIKKSLEEKKSIQVVNDQYRTPTLAEDVAAGSLLLAIHKSQGIYNIAGDELLNMYDLAIKVANFWNLDTSLITPTTSDIFLQPAKRPLYTGLCIKKAIQELHYQPRSIEEAFGILDKQIGRK